MVGFLFYSKGANQMKINWTNRLKNGATLSALIGTLFLLAKQITEIFGVDISQQLEVVSGIIGTILTLLATLGIITNPNTKGVTDAGIDLDLSKPRNEETNPVEFKAKQDDSIPTYDDLEGVKDHTELDEDEAPFKNETKPFGVDWDEDVEEKNVEAIKHEN